MTDLHCFNPQCNRPARLTVVWHRICPTCLGASPPGTSCINCLDEGAVPDSYGYYCAEDHARASATAGQQAPHIVSVEIRRRANGGARASS